MFPVARRKGKPTNLEILHALPYPAEQGCKGGVAGTLRPLAYLSIGAGGAGTSRSYWPGSLPNCRNSGCRRKPRPFQVWTAPASRRIPTLWGRRKEAASLGTILQRPGCQSARNGGGRRPCLDGDSIAGQAHDSVAAAEAAHFAGAAVRAVRSADGSGLRGGGYLPVGPGTGLLSGSSVALPPQSQEGYYDRELYRRRNEVERFRRIFTRCDKLEPRYLGLALPACIFELLNRLF